MARLSAVTFAGFLFLLAFVGTAVAAPDASTGTNATAATAPAKEKATVTCHFHNCIIRHHLNDKHTFTCAEECNGFPRNDTIGFADASNSSQCKMSPTPSDLPASDKRRNGIIPRFVFLLSEEHYKSLTVKNLNLGTAPFPHLTPNLTFPNAASFCTFYPSANESSRSSRFECLRSLSGDPSRDIESRWYGNYTGGKLSNPNFKVANFKAYNMTHNIPLAERWGVLQDGCHEYSFDKSAGHSEIFAAYHALVYLFAAVWLLL
ncbi:hypothetical protein BV898_08853 [Hypsibius exemplaris]|uniref:Uncharacterized protein n=1 Tax=Hypsibius exemplaris TaxID=2072580 RepID=A0A1W0WP62_HYPEX|nr:hypothetical protein BV898_08853 [Hypsibius exemplaris]